MQNIHLPDWAAQGLVTEILGAVIIALALCASRAASRWLSRHTRVGIPVKLLLVAVLALVGLGISAYLSAWASAILVFLASIVSVHYTLKDFFALGVIDVSKKAIEGIGFGQSLKLVQHSISFLGIGAGKLTESPEFEIAIQRCSSGTPCRFLLSDLNDQLLERLANRHGGTSDEYKDKVLASLKILARMRIDKSHNIEVKFHPIAQRKDFQQFRLMFIDDQTCLLSWTVWGNHVGRENPQIVLRNDVKAKDHRKQLYSAFKAYFEEMWEAAGTNVDLTTYR